MTFSVVKLKRQAPCLTTGLGPLLVGETHVHGTPECVSFSFIDAGSVLLP